MFLSLLRLLRPRHWTKNGLCIAGLVFGGRLTDTEAIPRTLLVFGVFVIASSSVYALNDVLDVERDRQHPQKRLRPVPAGLLPIWVAVITAIMLGSASLALGYLLGTNAWVCLIAFFVVNLAYTLRLKHIPLLDVACIAGGFVLRLLAGIYGIDDTPTTWITLCTLFLSLFLGFAKRRSELAGATREANTTQRPVLTQYSLPLLDSLVSSTATMAVMSYALFTATSGKNPSLVITVPIVYYAIMHYKLLLMSLEGAEEPETILLRDRKIQVSIMLWLVSYLWVLNGHIHLFR